MRDGVLLWGRSTPGFNPVTITPVKTKPCVLALHEYFVPVLNVVTAIVSLMSAVFIYRCGCFI